MIQKIKKTLLVFLSLISMVSYSQELEKVKERLKEGKAIYYVLKSDLKTKHGEYIIKDYKTRTTLLEGNFVQGKKEGKWSEFNESGSIKSLGKYSKGEKVFEWGFYNSFGKLEQIYNFDTNVMVWSKNCKKDTEYDVLINSEFIKSKLDCPPSCIGSLDHLKLDFIKSTIKVFPNGKGSILISYFTVTITKDGVAKNIEFIDKRLKNEKVKAFLRSKILEKKGQWIPASLNGSKVDAKIKIYFTIGLSFME